MRTWFNDVFLMVGVMIISYTLIGVVWQILELLFEDKIQPSIPDTIIGILFAFTVWLYVNERTK